MKVAGFGNAAQQDAFPRQVLPAMVCIGLTFAYKKVILSKAKKQHSTKSIWKNIVDVYRLTSSNVVSSLPLKMTSGMKKN